jgi:hypothetical protein
MGFQNATGARGMMVAGRANSAAPVAIAACCLTIILALGGVGVPDGLVVRHVVPTLPLWAAIVLGLRRSPATGWLALPFFLFWLTLMTLICLFLAGIARVVTGHFSSLEIAMTIVVGAASATGIALFARLKAGLLAWRAASLFVAATAFQFACFRLSQLPAIAHR